VRGLLAVAVLLLVQVGVSAFYWIPDGRVGLILEPTWDLVGLVLLIVAWSLVPSPPRWAERTVTVALAAAVFVTVAVACGQGLLQRLFGRDLILALDIVFVRALLKMLEDAEALWVYWLLMLALAAGFALVAVGPYFAIRELRALVTGRPRRQLALAGAALVYLGIGLAGAGVHPPVSVQAVEQLAMVWNLKDPLQVTARRLEEEAAPNRALVLPAGTAKEPSHPRRIYVFVVEAYGHVLLSGQKPRFREFPAFLEGQGSALAGAGYTIRSKLMRAPVFGGGSWMSDASLFCGVTVNNQKRFVSLFQSEVRCLPKFLKDGGYRTALAMPSTQTWDDHLLTTYGFDAYYFKKDLVYSGPRIGWAFMPDQFVIDFMHRHEVEPHRNEPLFVAMVLTSSHVPWAAVPPLIEWNLGDGARFAQVTPKTFPNQLLSGRDYEGGYITSIEYSLATIADYLERLPPDDRSLAIVLGDHQPQQPVASRWKDVRWVPIHIIGRDAHAVDEFAKLGYERGIVPPAPRGEPNGNDRFLTELLTALGAQRR
jgi:hypothetical protein